jgi:hypothetical protein
MFRAPTFTLEYFGIGSPFQNQMFGFIILKLRHPWLKRSHLNSSDHDNIEASKGETIIKSKCFYLIKIDLNMKCFLNRMERCIFGLMSFQSCFFPTP